MREFLLITQLTKEKQNEFDQLLCVLCPSLKINVINEMMKVVLNSNPVI